jgi:hypothetical protein
MEVIPAGAMHGSGQAAYVTAVNVQGFTVTFNFTPGDVGNVGLVFNNCNTGSNRCGSGAGYTFSSGAGCEGGFAQAYATTPPGPNNVFALMLDLYSPLTISGGFTYSSAQIYQSVQSPCLPPNGGQPQYYPTNKISTSPVNLTNGTQGNPAGLTKATAYSCSGTVCTITAPNSFTSGQRVTENAVSGDGLAALSGATFTVLGAGLSSSQYEITTSAVTGSGSTTSMTQDQFSVVVTYAGNTLSMCLVDVTLNNGTCTSATTGTGTYYTNTWSGVYIPAIVGGTTAYMQVGEGVGETTTVPMYLNGLSFSTSSATSGTGLTAWNAGSSYNVGIPSVASPTYSVAPGTYSGTQTVTISDSTASSYICYTLSSSYPTLTPQPDSNGACAAGTLYTGPVSIPSTTTLYAMAGIPYTAFTYPTPTGVGLPSTLVAGTYTIGGSSPASQPTFSPVAGTYVGTQSVTLSTSSSGAIMCYTTNGATPATNGTTGCATGTLYSSAISVAASETIKAVAGGTGYTDSAVGSAAYTITTTAAPVITLASGTYVLPQTTTITDSTGGATIRYCTTTYGGSCSPGTTYTSALTIASAETICANAIFNSSTSATVCNNYAQSTPFTFSLGGNITVSGNIVTK